MPDEVPLLIPLLRPKITPKAELRVLPRHLLEQGLDRRVLLGNRAGARPLLPFAKLDDSPLEGSRRVLGPAVVAEAQVLGAALRHEQLHGSVHGRAVEPGRGSWKAVRRRGGDLATLEPERADGLPQPHTSGLAGEEHPAEPRLQDIGVVVRRVSGSQNHGDPVQQRRGRVQEPVGRRRAYRAEGVGDLVAQGRPGGLLEPLRPHQVPYPPLGSEHHSLWEELQQVGDPSRVVRVDVGQQDQVEPVDPHGAQRTSEVGDGGRGAGVDQYVPAAALIAQEPGGQVMVESGEREGQVEHVQSRPVSLVDCENSVVAAEVEILHQISSSCCNMRECSAVIILNPAIRRTPPPAPVAGEPPTTSSRGTPFSGTTRPPEPPRGPTGASTATPRRSLGWAGAGTGAAG